MPEFLRSLLWKLPGCAVFSLVTAPAVALLLGLLAITVLTGSPAKSYLELARSQVGSTPTNMVMTCNDVEKEFLSRRPTDCPRHAVDTDAVADIWDKSLLKFYLIVAGLAAVCWVVCEFITQRTYRVRYGIDPRCQRSCVTHIKPMSKTPDDK